MHVLDNPVWHALVGTHATLAQRVGSAARYVPDVTVFAALDDDATPAAWDGLADLIGAGGATVLTRRDVTAPATWTEQFNAPCRQMWLRDANAPAPQPDDQAPNDQIPNDQVPYDCGAPLVSLGAADVAQMLALVQQTRPGPFLSRTIELGTYLGVRDGDRLIAMAGERLHLAGFTEISAVCTDPGYRGQGLASRLVTAVARGIRARDETPFLHLRDDNDAAHRVYAALGFETRTFVSVAGVRAPG
jgi:ribosomal protein S18 acetylase RimI-like enzyme